MPPAFSPDFAPLALSVDDRLPADIELVMGYRQRLDPDTCSAALVRGLRAFPHLTGKREGMERIVPSSEGFVLESLESGEALGIRDMETRPLPEQSAAFVPRARESRLFQARLTITPGLSVLGLRVSHAAVDGMGLALFLMHANGIGSPPLFHERRHGFGKELVGSDEAPHGYREAGSAPENDALAGSEPVVFAIPADDVRRSFHATSLLEARLKLAAFLCSSIREHFAEVALWCDPRGLNGIPPTYTGNAGCFLHFPNDPDLAKPLKATATRTGFRRIADTHRRLKLAESRGHPLAWDGAGRDVLQLNIVPHAVAGTDFGGGIPDYALLLSRNSSGLRLSLTPDASRFLIEACLPDGMGDELLGKCRAGGLGPVLWYGGEKPCK